jgi:leucyl aminopeptidase
MNITFASLIVPTSGTVILPVAEAGGLGTLGQALDKSLKGGLKRAMQAADFTGKRESSLDLLTPHGSTLARIILLGIGDPKNLTHLAVENLGGYAGVALTGAKVAHATLLADSFKQAGLNEADFAAHLASGVLLRTYRFDLYRTQKSEHVALRGLTVATAAATPARKIFVRLAALAAGVALARDLVSEPGNVLYPASYAKRCLALRQHGLTVDILDEKAMAKLGMGALLGVAQGSTRPARLVTLRWQGDKKAKNQAPIALVGKGVTFDSGGISLKPGPGMEEMIYDMAGSAAVVGTMLALATSKAAVNVVGVVGLVENMPDGNAQRPGDIVTSMSGQTIEVHNTDAEGRLVLADAVWYTQKKFKPRAVIDLATLTGAVIIALGHEYGGLFANDDKLAQALLTAGDATGEKLWRLPLGASYDAMINADTADMKNISGGRDAGSTIGAQFIQRFVEKSMPWAHLDIAGTAWTKKAQPLCPKGATGYGVRLLYQYLTAL